MKTDSMVMGLGGIMRLSDAKTRSITAETAGRTGVEGMCGGSISMFMTWRSFGVA